MSVDSDVLVKFSATLAKAIDLAVVQAAHNYSREYLLPSGVGADQADQLFSDTRTIAASGTDDLDLSGVLVDAVGATLAMARVKAILVKADPANVNDVVVGGAASNQFLTPFGSATDKIKIKPGGLLLLVARDATAYAVTAATGDLLRIANGGAGTSVNYDILILGASA